MKFSRMISVVDSHTAGEPTRMVVDGVGKVAGATMAEKLAYLKTEKDWIRKILMTEPRGHRDMFGVFLLPPVDPTADAGIVFMDGGGYLNMCGHGSLGMCAMLVETGRKETTGNQTPVRLESPVGMVEGTVHLDDNGRIRDVSLVDVPSFAFALDQKIQVPGLGEVKVDVGYGGNFFAIVSAQSLGIASIGPENTVDIIRTGIAVRDAADAQIQVSHPDYPHIKSIDLCMITAEPSSPDHADARNMVVFGDGQADRSPCGTGTCARMAVMHRKGLLKTGEAFRHESSIGSVFRAKVLRETTVGDFPGIIPEIACRPYITGFNRYVLDPDDIFQEGFSLTAS